MASANIPDPGTHDCRPELELRGLRMSSMALFCTILTSRLGGAKLWCCLLSLSTHSQARVVLPLCWQLPKPRQQAHMLLRRIWWPQLLGRRHRRCKMLTHMLVQVRHTFLTCNMRPDILLLSIMSLHNLWRFVVRLSGQIEFACLKNLQCDEVLLAEHWLRYYWQSIGCNIIHP